MKVLIVAPAWVGDMVMTHCLVQLLAAQPGRQPTIHLLAPPATAPLGERMTEVAHTHRFDLAHGELNLRKRRAIAKCLAAEQFDQAIVLPNSWKSALVPYWAGTPQRTGWTGESRYGLLNDRRTLNKVALPLMIQRFMALALPEGAPLPEPYPEPRLQVNVGNAQAFMHKALLNTGRRVLALCPGAEFGSAKRWPEAHFARVAAAAWAAGYDVWLFGSAKDQPVAASVITQLLAQPAMSELSAAPAPVPGADRVRVERTGDRPQQIVNLAGQTSLLDAVDLLSRTDAVVCNDSGLMHIAAALAKPVVALYGSTSPDFTPPLSDLAQILRHPLPCSPCFSRSCPLGHLQCLRDLEPARVIHALAL